LKFDPSNLVICRTNSCLVGLAKSADVAEEKRKKENKQIFITDYPRMTFIINPIMYLVPEFYPTNIVSTVYPSTDRSLFLSARVFGPLSPINLYRSSHLQRRNFAYNKTYNVFISKHRTFFHDENPHS
jgi:hypothetical protein